MPSQFHFILQVYPSVVPDLCSEGPLIIFGQYKGGFPDTLKAKGILADMSNFTIDLKVQRPKDIPLDKVPLMTKWCMISIFLIHSILVTAFYFN